MCDNHKLSDHTSRLRGEGGSGVLRRCVQLPTVLTMAYYLVAAAICVVGVVGSPLHDAIASDLHDTFDAHLDAGEDINAIGDGGKTPLMKAVVMGKTFAVKRLLARGANATIGDKDGYTLCHAAGLHGHADIMELLVKHGLPCESEQHTDGHTPLHRAIWGREAGHTETVRVLLNNGADAHQAYPSGKKPLNTYIHNQETFKVLMNHTMGLTKLERKQRARHREEAEEEERFQAELVKDTEL